MASNKKGSQHSGQRHKARHRSPHLSHPHTGQGKHTPERLRFVDGLNMLPVVSLLSLLPLDRKSPSALSFTWRVGSEGGAAIFFLWGHHGSANGRCEE